MEHICIYIRRLNDVTHKLCDTYSFISQRHPFSVYCYTNPNNQQLGDIQKSLISALEIL